MEELQLVTLFASWLMSLGTWLCRRVYLPSQYWALKSSCNASCVWVGCVCVLCVGWVCVCVSVCVCVCECVNAIQKNRSIHYHHHSSIRWMNRKCVKIYFSDFECARSHIKPNLWNWNIFEYHELLIRILELTPTAWHHTHTHDIQ